MISLVHIFIAWFRRCQFLSLNLNANAFLNVLLLIEFATLIAEEVRLEEVLEYMFVNEIVMVADVEEEKDVHAANYFE